MVAKMPQTMLGGAFIIACSCLVDHEATHTRIETGM